MMKYTFYIANITHIYPTPFYLIFIENLIVGMLEYNCYYVKNILHSAVSHPINIALEAESARTSKYWILMFSHYYF